MTAIRNNIIFYAIDWLAATIAWMFFFLFRKWYIDKYPASIKEIFGDYNFLLALTILPLLWVLWYSFTGQYVNAHRQSRLKTVSRTFWQTLIGTLIIFFLFLLDDKVENYKNYYVSFTILFLLHFFITSVFRVIYLSYVKHRMAHLKTKITVILVGDKKSIQNIAIEIQNNKKLHVYDILGYLSIKENENIFGLKKLGSIYDIEEILSEYKPEDVLITLNTKNIHLMNELLLSLSLHEVNIKTAPEMYPYMIGIVRMNELIDEPLIDIFPDAMSPFTQNIKRSIDVMFSLFAIILLSPIFFTLVLILAIGDKGPIFYSQQRVGKGGKNFNLYKLRSMKPEAEPNGPALSSDNDERITAIGKVLRKWRLDELPQFWNVLKGDMSLIGPRPERLYYLQQMSKRVPQTKHLQRVKPGITSLGMVKYGYAQNVDEMLERLKYDVMYIDKRSISLDFKIFFYTIITLLLGRGK